MKPGERAHLLYRTIPNNERVTRTHIPASYLSVARSVFVTLSIGTCETQRGRAYSLSLSHGAPDAIDKDAHRPELRRQPLCVTATTTARAASLAALPLPCAQPLSLVYFPKPPSAASGTTPFFWLRGEWRLGLAGGAGATLATLATVARKNSAT